MTNIKTAILKKHLYFIIIFFLSTTQSFSQVQWNFNTGTLQGWSLTRFTSSFTASTLVLTTTSGNNPTITINPTSINAGTYKYLKIQLKNHSDGPTLLYTNIGTHKSTVITQNDASIKTYYINLTDPLWTGTFTNFSIQFKVNDNSVNGATFNAAGKIIEIQSISFVENIYSGASALYIDPSMGNDNNDGSIASPLQSISNALNICAANNISNAYVKSGTYNISAINITTVSPHMITLSPEPGGSAKIVLSNFKSIRFYSGAKNIEIKGFDIDGSPTDLQSHWDMLSQYVWQPNLLTTAKAGGGMAFQIEVAEDIKITDNHIHDFYQKAINIEDGRYITVQGNIIRNIAQRSLSGGHGIMRQQGSGSFSDADNASKYRWDISENLIYNVAQRIYSWVPSKGYMNMTLDEGKPILIDETPNHDVNMKARIKNNIIAYSHIDAVRLKPTNNLEVLNNTIFTANEHADGITDVTSGFNSSLYGTPYLNFISANNAVQVASSSMPYELNDSYASTNSSFSNNISKSGTISPSAVGTNLNADLFIDPLAGNFRLKPSISYTAGVQSSIFSAIDAKATAFSVSVATDNWVNNHKKNTQTLIDNFPGVDDGVAGNESVFTNSGVYALSDLEFASGRKSLYLSMNNTWKTDNAVTNDVVNHRTELNAYDGMYELVLPEDYSVWYDDIYANYLRDADNNGSYESPYATIRYGESVIRQNKILTANSLQVFEIASTNNFHQTTASGYTFTINGDLLIKFNYVPTGNETFDLITATDISGNFNNIRISGYLGTYTLQKVSGSTILRLSLTGYSNTWIGGTSTDWNNAVNWSLGMVPTVATSVTISTSATNRPLINTDIFVKDILLTGGSVTLMSTISLSGNLSNEGLFDGIGKIKMAGSSAQTITGTGSIHNLEIDNSSGVTIPVGIGNVQTITGKLSPTSGILYTNSNLLLSSNAFGTARVGQGAAAGGYIIGNIVTQRYLSKLTGTGRSGRAWRLVSIPVSGNNQLREMFMGGQLGTDLTSATSRSNQPANLGTVVIGHNQPDALTATGSGYDWLGVPGQVSSLRYYQQNATNGSFASNQVPSLTTTYSAAAQGYMLFARGDRQQTYNGTNNASTTTLQATGTLKQGTLNVTIPPLASAGFVLVGNPYMAVLDLEKVVLDNAGVIDNTIYIWDANIDGNSFKQGGYRSVTRTGLNNWTATGAGTNPQYIESGSAFFVKPTVSGGTLSIKETHKVDGTPGIAPHGVMSDGPSRLFINLEVADTSSRRLVDGAVTFFDANYKQEISDPVDIQPMTNLTSGSLTIRHPKARLSMEGRPWPLDSAARTIDLDMRNLGDDPYILSILPANLNRADFSIWLKDHHLQKETILHTNNETLYPFRRTGIPAIDSSRFEIVYRLSKTTNSGTLTPDGTIGVVTPRLYPNPAKADDVQLSLGSLEPGHYEVRVLDMSGRSVLTKPVAHVNSANSYQILKGQKLSTGQYLIRVSRNGQLLETLSFIHK